MAHVARAKTGAAVRAGAGAVGRAGIGAVAVLAAAAAGSGGAAAQEAGDRMGWQPYLGCWTRPAAAMDAIPGEEIADEGVLCFAEVGGEVQMLTIADGAVTHREPFPADGRPRSVEQDGCEGTETARFSEDRRRIYTASEVACDDGSAHRSTGIISMPSPTEWLDVRAMEVGGRVTAWSQWYQRASSGPLAEAGVEVGDMAAPLAVRGAASYAAAPARIGDVIDAVGNAHPRAVEAWIAETGRPFARLDAHDLVRLDDAGVPGSVVDVVVAVSFPERFALNREDAYADEGYLDDRRAARTIWARRGLYDGYYAPFYYGSCGISPRGHGYYSYGRRCGSWGDGWGWNGGYYRPVIVDVTRTRTNGGGRAIAGKGYRGPRSVSDDRPRSSGAWAPSGSRGSGAVSRTGGGSRGSSTGRTATGRKAKPRGGK